MLKWEKDEYLAGPVGPPLQRQDGYTKYNTIHGAHKYWKHRYQSVISRLIREHSSSYDMPIIFTKFKISLHRHSNIIGFTLFIHECDISQFLEFHYIFALLQFSPQFHDLKNNCEFQLQ